MTTTGRTVRRGRPTSALGDVNGARYGGPKGSSSSAMNVLVAITTMAMLRDPLPFEEKKSASPPPLLLGLVALLRLVL